MPFIGNRYPDSRDSASRRSGWWFPIVGNMVPEKRLGFCPFPATDKQKAKSLIIKILQVI